MNLSNFLPFLETAEQPTQEALLEDYLLVVFIPCSVKFVAVSRTVSHAENDTTRATNMERGST